MLKTTRKMFTIARRDRKPCDGSSRLSSAVKPGSAEKNKMSTAAMITLTIGPARATMISSLGFSGMRSSRATPPIGSSVMSGVFMP